MYFVREAPVIAPQIIVERNETIPFTVKIGESSAIRMHPYMSVYIFMNMESRTRTVSVTIFHPHLLTLYHPGSRVKMNNDSRLFLFEPNFRCTVYISRKNRLVRQLLAGHRGIVYMLVGFQVREKESVRVGCNDGIVIAHSMYGSYTGFCGKFVQTKLPALFLIAPDSSPIGSKADIVFTFSDCIKCLVHAVLFSLRLHKVVHRLPLTGTYHSQPIISQQPVIAGSILIDLIKVIGRKQTGLSGINLRFRRIVFLRKRHNTDSSVILRQQPDCTIKQHLNRMNIVGASLFTRSRDLLKRLRFRIETMDTVVISQQP